MQKIVFENLPETYEVGNLIFFKEPYRASVTAWGLVHEGCRILLLNSDTPPDGLEADIVAYPKSKEFNVEIYDYLNTLSPDERKKYIVQTPISGGGLSAVYE